MTEKNSKANDTKKVDENDESGGEEAYELEVVEEDKEEEPRTIETGDSVKVKQVFDEALVEILPEKCGYEQDFSSENVKLILMVISCVFAMVAQFYPMPFPDNRMILGVCCGAYFLLSTVLQFIVSYIEVDLVLVTKDRKEYGSDMKTFKTHPAISIRTDFPKYQEWLTFKVHYAKDKSDASNKLMSVNKMYVGKYFTEAGEFLHDVYEKDVQTIIRKFEEGKMGGKYDHKSE
jgi:signal peptidase complex subunit 2